MERPKTKPIEITKDEIHAILRMWTENIAATGRQYYPDKDDLRFAAFYATRITELVRLLHEWDVEPAPMSGSDAQSS